MEGCLLCLDINNEILDCIKVNSLQWNEFKIQKLIEKHLWIMDPVRTSSWLCHTCWLALYDFHKFYLRIEEAHIDFGRMMNKKIKPEQLKEDIPKFNDKKDLCLEVASNEFHREPEILIDDLLMEYNKSNIKVEQCENLANDNMQMIQKGIRGCDSKDIENKLEVSNQDPLNNSKNSLKCKTKKKEPNVQLNTTENTEIKTIRLKQIPQDLPMSDLSNDSHYDNFDSCTDSDYKPVKLRERSKKNYKLSDKLNSDCDECNTESNHKPKKIKSKQTVKQKEEFLVENFKLICALCQIPMVSFKNLLTHFEYEHKERGYAVCCSKKFYNRGNLVEHIQRHLDPSIFKCNECGKVLASRYTLKIHQEKAHLAEEEKKFSCTECGKNYADQHLLAFHKNAVHLKKYLKICDICGITLRPDNFERHMLEHEGKSIPTENCEICGTRVSCKKVLKRHMLMQHPVGGKQLHPCHICSHMSHNLYALKEHIRNAHKRDKIYKCTMCERGFKRKLALKEHVATHTGIALYTCPWCPKTFNASGGMHAHRKRQHPVQWEEAQRQKKLQNCSTSEVTI